MHRSTWCVLHQSTTNDHYLSEHKEVGSTRIIIHYRCNKKTVDRFSKRKKQSTVLIKNVIFSDAKKLVFQHLSGKTSYCFAAIAALAAANLASGTLNGEQDT